MINTLASEPVRSPNRKLTPQDRIFVELVIAGKTKSGAFAESRKVPESASTRAAGPRLWKKASVVAYREELEARTAKGEVAGGQEAIATHAEELARMRKLSNAAASSRAELAAWLEGVVWLSPANALEADGVTVKEQYRPFVESYKIRRGPDGTTVEIRWPSKLTAFRVLAEMKGFLEPEKEGEEDLGALLRRLIPPTPGIHGEHVNEAALAAQAAMSNGNSHGKW